MLRRLGSNPWFIIALILIVIAYPSLHETTTTSYASSNGTQIYTDITRDTVWTRDGSPYIVMAPITIHRNATLRIEPGVVVVFNNEIRITVRGAVIAEGDANNRVVFKLLDEKRKPHIYIGLSGGKLVLRYTSVYLNLILSGPFMTAESIPNSSIILENSKIAGFIAFEDSETRLDNSELVISNTIILGGVYRPYGAETPPLWKRLKNEWYDFSVTPYIRTNNSVIRVENSIILGGFGVRSLLYSGWYPWIPSNVSISNSVFIGMFGLLYDLRDITLKNITYVYIVDSVFIDCMISIEVLTKGGTTTSSVVLRNNSIVNSTVLRLLDIGVDARYNWWGDPTGPYSIRVNPLGKGVEIWLISSRAEIIYPWLTAPPKEPVKLGIVFKPEPLLGKYYFTPANITLQLELPLDERDKVLVSYVNVSSYDELLREATFIEATEYTLQFDKAPIDRDLNLTVIAVTRDMRTGVFRTTIRLCEKPTVDAQIGIVNPMRRVYFEGVGGDVVAESELKINTNVYADVCTSELLNWLRNNTRVELKLIDLRRKVEITPVKVESSGLAPHLYGARYIFNLTDGLYKAYLYVDHPFGQLVRESGEFYVDAQPPITSAEVVSVTREQEANLCRVVLRVSIEEALGATLRVYLNESIVKSINLPPGTHDISFNASRAGYYLVKLEAVDPLGRTSIYKLSLSIAEEEPGELTTTTPTATQTPQASTPVATTITTPTQQAQVTETRTSYESTAIPLWLILLIVLLIILIVLFALLLLRRRKHREQKSKQSSKPSL